MVIPINEVSLDSAAEKIMLEVTEVNETVDNIYDQTHSSLNISVWCLFITSYGSNTRNKI